MRCVQFLMVTLVQHFLYDHTSFCYEHESSTADTEDIEIDDNRCMSFYIKFKYLKTFFVPELSDLAVISQRISPAARKLFKSMNRRVLSNKKIRMDIRRMLYEVIAVNIALWGCESWTLKEENRAKLETFHHSCLHRICKWTMAVAYCGETDHERKG
jgi:hypothetical protein